MCTVSYVSHNGLSIITSNRDEHIGRQTAAAPGVETINNRKIIFPKDAKAGGTWFAASEEGGIAVLLNGAFVKHIPAPPYRKSRGLIVLEIISAASPAACFAEMDLDKIEPFTLILLQTSQLTELRWDGNSKHEKELDTAGNYIWSSATLYDEAAVAERNRLFDRFMNNHKTPSPADVYRFHANNNEDEENGFVINRKIGLKTFSITQAIIQPGKIDFLHYDLLQNRQFEEMILPNPVLINQ